MKKAVIIILTLTLTLSMAVLTGCGGGDESADKVYTIATDTVFAPFEFTDENGELTGIDMDILAAIAEDQGFTYKVQPLGFDNAVMAVETGEADGIMAGLSIDEENRETFDFSDSYYDSTVCVAVKSDSEYTSLADLKGKKVSVKNGTEGSFWGEELKDEYDLTLNYCTDSVMMYESVKSGSVDACIEDYPVVVYEINQGNDLKIIERNRDTYVTPYGFAVHKGDNQELIDMFNAGLANIKENGTYEEILEKYH